VGTRKYSPFNKVDDIPSKKKKKGTLVVSQETGLETKLFFSAQYIAVMASNAVVMLGCHSQKRTKQESAHYNTDRKPLASFVNFQLLYAPSAIFFIDWLHAHKFMLNSVISNMEWQYLTHLPSQHPCEVGKH